MRLWLAAMLLLAAAVPARALAQPTTSEISFDLTPAIEEVGLGLLGALDVVVLGADLIRGMSERPRRGMPVDAELVLGALQLVAAGPAWWSWSRESNQSRRDVALAGCVELTSAGALMLALGILGHAIGPPRAGLGAMASATSEGATVTLIGSW